MSRKVFPKHNKIKSLREKNGWTQEWVSMASGISNRTYQRIEAGDGCSPETLKNIAAVFDINFKELLHSSSTLGNNMIGDQYQASWLKLISLLAISNLFKPLLISSVLVMLLVGSVSFAYVLHQTEVVEIKAFNPMTDQERKELQVFMEQELKEDPDHPLFSLPSDRKNPNNEYKPILLLTGYLWFMTWLFTFTHSLGKTFRTRDWCLLVETPLSIKASLMITRIELWAQKWNRRC